MMELLTLLVGLAVLGVLLVLAPRPTLMVGGLVLKVCGMVLLGGILLAFGWLGTGEREDG